MATSTEKGRPSHTQPIPESSHRGVPGTQTSNATSPPSKRELAKWWIKFSGRKPEKEGEKDTHTLGIFGVPLAESIRYANVAISLSNERGESFVYGYVPIVVAKCGVYLKEKATDVEGIFRLSGSAKRIKDLQTIFDSPDKYGKGLDWTGYTVHDAANILRRYLNKLPEPIVPLDAYEKFRDPLRSYQARIDPGPDGHAKEISAAEHESAVAAYQKLITELPALSRQLLLYILDLLAVFASKSEFNRMTAANLAAIFQPGIISHPNHDMAPQEYRLSQDVLIFLIENQDNFLIGMSGTEVDEKTREDVQSGVPSVRTPKSGLGRAASDASTGPKKLGIRRNASAASRSSRDRNSPNVSSPGTPSTPAYGAAVGTTGSLGRSNTVPSKRSPALGTSAKFARRGESPATAQPPVDATITVLPETETATQVPGPARSSLSTQEPAQAPSTTTPTSKNVETVGRPPSAQTGTQSSALSTAPAVSPGSGRAAQSRSRERIISNLFTKSPKVGPSQLNTGERQPRKLQKRHRVPGLNESAQNSAASLHHDDGAHTPLVSPVATSQHQGDPMAAAGAANPNIAATPVRDTQPESAFHTPPSVPTGHAPSQGLKLPQSPTHSLRSRSSMTEPSDLEIHEEPTGARSDKRRKWRFSSSTKKADDLALQPPPPVGQLYGGRTSNSSFGSIGKPRHSLTVDSQSQLSHRGLAESSGTMQPSLTGLSSTEAGEASKDGDSEKRGLFGKIKAWREDRKEREAEKERAKSPPRQGTEHSSSRNSLSAFAAEHLSTKPQSFDKSREDGLPVVTEQPQTEARTAAQPGVAQDEGAQPLAQSIPSTRPDIPASAAADHATTLHVGDQSDMAAAAASPDESNLPIAATKQTTDVPDS